jgi:hypothetical protein
MRTLALIMGIVCLALALLNLGRLPTFIVLGLMVFGIVFIVSFVVASRQPSGKSDLDINTKSVNCPKCGERMRSLRTPASLRQAMWGGWTCPKCGCEMDKWGKAIED